MSDALFDLTLTDDQAMMRDSVQRFASAEIQPLARNADEAGEAPAGFYDRTLELGLALMPIPEALGGAGASRSPVSNALNAEDLGRGDMSLALGALAPLSVVNTLIDQGTSAQQESLLPRFCGDSFYPATVAFMEPRARFEPTEPAFRARRDGDGFLLSGTKTMVPLGLGAECVLVIGELADEGPAAFIVEGQPGGLERNREQHMGLHSLELGRLAFDEVRVPGDALLGNGPFDLQRFIDLSRIGLSALAVGTCQAVLDYVIDYCNDRVAFGEPITHRQSVAFMIADIAIELDAMRLMTWRAAAAAERGGDFHQQAFLAKQFAGEYAMQIGTNGVQLLGGHGFCRDHPVEMWYRNLRSIAFMEGALSA